MKDLRNVNKSDLARESFRYSSCTNWPIDEPNEYVQVYKLQEMTLVRTFHNICRKLKQYVVWCVRIWQLSLFRIQ